jgi:hypothetical protein
MPGEGRFRNGRYRLRTWLRAHEPTWLYDRWAIPKGSRDCGNHEFYKSDDQVDRCYHCEVGIRANDFGVIDHARRRLSEGAAQEDVIRLFRDSGLSFIRSVRALSLAGGISVGEAKEATHVSETWAAERSDREAFWADLVQAATEDSKAH